jgi:hypothetical protein
MEPSSLSAIGSQAVARAFTEHQRLTVRQRKRWLEMILNFEQKNRYDVFDEEQRHVFSVEEQGASLGVALRRIFLGPARPFTSHVIDARTGEVAMVVTRPFRFFFHRVEVFAGTGEKLGAIEREWDPFRRIYRIEDSSGQAIAQVFGPIFRPWTFEIHQHGQAVGAIRKRWRGLGAELFTDADNFGVELSGIADPRLRALVFAATVLIDIVHFERHKG